MQNILINNVGDKIEVKLLINIFTFDNRTGEADNYDTCIYTKFGNFDRIHHLSFISNACMQSA